MKLAPYASRVRLVLGASAAAFLAFQIARALTAPDPLLARAEDRKEASRVLAPERDERADLPEGKYVVGRGLIEPLGGTVRVATAVAGKVSEVRVTVGRHVEAGEAMVVLESEAESARVEIARADVGAAEAELAGLLGGRSEDILAAEAEESAAAAKAKLSVDVSERTKRLGASATEQERVREAVQVDIDRATQKAASLRAEALRRGARPEAKSAARARVLAARSRLRLAEIELARRTVRAPKAGDVLDVLVRVGEQTAPDGDPIVLLGDLARPTVRMEVDERALARVSVGAKARVRATSHPGKDFGARVVELGQRMGRKKVKGDDSSEPVDVRVREVVLELDPTRELLTGQRVSVFVDPQP